MSRTTARIMAWVVICIVTSLTGLASLHAADAVPADRRLGNDVIGFLSIRNISELKAGWAKTQFGLMMQDKELQPFLSQFEPHWNKVTQEFESQVGLPLMDLLNVPSGEFAIAAVHSAGKQIGGVAFLDFGDKRETLDKVLEKMNAALIEGDRAKRSEEEIEGTQVVIYTFPENEDESEDEEETPKIKGFNSVAFFIKDTSLVVASRTDILKSVLTRWDGQNERIFAEKQAYKYIKERCKNENAATPSEMIFFIDPIGITKAALAASGADSNQSALFLGTLPSLGLDKLRGIGGSAELGSEQFDSASRMMVYIEPPTTGVLTAFQFPPIAMAPPKWVTADVGTYASVNWDVAGAYTTVESMYDTFLGQGAWAKIIDDLAEEEDGPKIHIKRDIIDNLAGRIVIYGVSPEKTDDEAEELVAEHYVFALELKDDAPIRGAIEKLMDLGGFPGKAREFKGEKIIEFVEEESEQPLRPAITIAMKQLAIATHVAELESLLQNDPDRESLVDTDLYKEVAKKFPNQVSWISFQRADTQLKAIYDGIKGGALAQDLTEEDSEFKLDTTTLPDFEVLRKYLKPSGSYLIPDEKGWFMMTFQLKSEAKE